MSAFCVCSSMLQVRQRLGAKLRAVNLKSTSIDVGSRTTVDDINPASPKTRIIYPNSHSFSVPKVMQDLYHQP